MLRKTESDHLTKSDPYVPGREPMPCENPELFDELGVAQNQMLLVDPEGGLSTTEITAAQRADFISGKTRAARAYRNAALMALSLLQTRWGDLA